MGMTVADEAELNRRIARTLAAVAEGRQVEVGRNDPCPCGSGRKFKKCHLPRGSNRLAVRSLSEAERRKAAEAGIAEVRAEAIAQGHAPEVVDAEIARMRGVVARLADQPTDA